MDFVGRTLVGKYRIEKLLGQGGMGTVWRGTHAVTGRKIAIKILDEKFLSNSSVVQRFGREARAASSIAHEGIVEVLDLDQTEEGIPFLVMEFLEGESLAHRIDYGERMNEEQLVPLGAQLLDALHAAHESGVVHRDLKPDNIYVVPGRRGEMIKILDFGISWKDDEQDAKLTVTGSVLGTPHYMSPEQAMGDSDTDRRVDIYAAGVVLYECAVGAVPFEGANYNKLLRIILDSTAVPPSKRGAKISPAVEAVILKALSKRKEDRPRTAAEMRLMLLKAGRGEAEPRSVPSGLLSLDEPGEAIDRKDRSDPAVEARWLDAPLENAPRSRAEIALPAPRPESPQPRAPREPAARDPSPRDHAPRDQGSSRGSDLGGLEGLDDITRDGPSSHSLEIDERALERKPASSTRASVSRMPAVTASRTSSASLPAVGATPAEAPRPASSSGPVGASAARPAPGGQSSYGASGYGASSYATSPQGPPADAGRSPMVRWSVVAAVALLAVGLVAFGLRTFLEREPEPVQPPPVVDAPDPLADSRPQPTKQAPAQYVDLTVLIEPAGVDARMRLDGIPGATSPIRVRRGTRHVLEVSAPGFRDERVEIRAERDQRVRVTLQPAP